ncbi:ubiquilin-1-like isoform X1 [Mytilus californianus]|uniref:ubiquilin-1-like isoform X1 n=1 Tax=Mytilus californianus TaxID=6549 RepID=UPI0022453585|nr:ubiquilin-1-like isoform X1 [Mytilus californianus]
MADERMDESRKTMKITVKTPKEKQEMEIDTHAHVKELREMVSQKFSAPVEQLCLIFAGKILKDEDTLEQHQIKDGLTVHLVIKSSNRSQEQAAQRAAPASSPSAGGTTIPSSTPGSQPDVGQTPFGLGGLGGLAGLGNLGMGSANFMEMQQRMQREMMGNPDMLRQMMDNPMVQSLMSNPDVMRQMITSNPQMRELMERNPEITHMLNNPELMRQTMELARNPAMMQELMRSQDRAMSNLESLPGGFNALQRMYRDIQEPMLNAAQEGMGQNPFSALIGRGGGTESEQQGRENTDPLPNPWAPGSTQSSSTPSTTTTPATSSGTSSTPRQPQGMFDSPGMQSLMSQITQNPQLMENMLQAPYMQAMLQNLSSNPEMAQNMLSANPMFAGNPQLQEQMRTQLPNMVQQLQNPNVQSFLTNPRAMQAMMRIQEGMQELEQEAPGLFPGMNPLLTRPQQTTTDTPTTGSTSTSLTSPTSPSTDSTSTTTTADTTTSTTTTTTSAPAPVPGQSPEQMSNLMAHMMSLMAQGTNNQPPEQRYATELEQMAAMGFIDREQNLRALTATMGNVNDAIDRILSSRS